MPIVEAGEFTPTFTWLEGGVEEPTDVIGYYFRNNDYVHGVIYVYSISTFLDSAAWSLSLPIEPTHNFTELFQLIGVSSLDHLDIENNSIAVIRAYIGAKLIYGEIYSEPEQIVSGAVISTTFAYKINN